MAVSEMMEGEVRTAGLDANAQPQAKPGSADQAQEVVKPETRPRKDQDDDGSSAVVESLSNLGLPDLVPLHVGSKAEEDVEPEPSSPRDWDDNVPRVILEFLPDLPDLLPGHVGSKADDPIPTETPSTACNGEVLRSEGDEAPSTSPQAGTDCPSGDAAGGPLDVEAVRVKGNEAYKSKAFGEAASWYLKCLDADPGCVKARRNLVQTYLQLREWDKAAKEARVCVEHDDSDAVSRTRWASALIGLGAYADAVSLLKDKPMIAGGRAMLKEAEELLEEAQGRFSWDKLYRTFSPRRFADYAGPVAVETRRGPNNTIFRVMYVTRDVMPGELLLVANPIAVTHPKGPRLDPDVHMELLSEVKRLGFADPLVAYQLSSLYDDTQASLAWSNPPVTLFVPPLTEAEYRRSVAKAEESEPLGFLSETDMSNIIRMNALHFDTTGTDDEDASHVQKSPEPFRVAHRLFGLYGLPSFINHSCTPNTVMLSISDTVFYRATRPIKQGEEVLVNYMDGCDPAIWTYLPKAKRDFHLFARWYFVCTCARCKAEDGHLAKLIQEEITGVEIAMKAVYATYVKQELVEAGEPCPPRDDPRGWEWARKGTHAWLLRYINSAEERWATLPEEDANYCRALHVHPLMMMFGHRQDAHHQDITELGQLARWVLKIVAATSPGSIYHARRAVMFVLAHMHIGSSCAVLRDAMRDALRARYGRVPDELLEPLQNGLSK